MNINMSKCRLICLWVFGGVFIIFGGLMVGLWPVIFGNVLSSEMILSKSSKSFSLWKDTPIPMYMDFYMFNWTNPRNTLKFKEKPHFEELGPYVFREHHTKVISKWNDNGTVTFKQKRTWHFVPHLSNGKLSDKITNVNVIAMTIGSIIEQKHLSKFLLEIIDPILVAEESKVYVTKTVQELIFDGYDDHLLNLVEKLKAFVKIDIPFTKFGWFYGRNESLDYDGVFNMYTASVGGLSKLGVISSWNYSPMSPSFRDTCAKVEGTTGELWPINASKSDIIKIFATDICSSLALSSPVNRLKEGVKGVMFKGEERVFDNGTHYVENSCYVSSSFNPSGVRDISTCRYGAPAFVSYPHFYLGDPILVDLVSGMSPSPEKHSFDIKLHKLTSIPLEVNARLQINIFTHEIKYLSFYKNLTTAFFPMLWFNERAAITEDLAWQLKMLDNVSTYVLPGFIVILCIGCLLFIIGLCLLSQKYFNKASHECLLETSS